MAKPAVSCVKALGHRGVEQLARPLAAFPVGVTATRRERRGEFKNLLPLGEVRVEVAESVDRSGEVGPDARLSVRSVARSIAPA